MGKKVRRVVVRRKKSIPKLNELYEVASSLGMTVKEYVDYQNEMNSDKSRRRNYSSSYDWGPIPYRGPDGKKLKETGK